MRPTLWILGIIASCVITALAGFSWADDRWQHKVDADEQMATLKAETKIIVAAQDARVDGIKAEVQWTGDRQEKRRIEDNLFKLEQIHANRLTDNERAQIAKYRRDLRSLTDYWNARGKPL